MEVNEIKDAVYKTAKEKGFWDDCGTIAAQLDTAHQVDVVLQAFYSQKLMLIVSELGEALEALRSDKFANKPVYDALVESAVNECYSGI